MTGRRFLDRVPRRRKPLQVEAPTPPPVVDAAPTIPVVPYLPVRCPNCGSRYPITGGHYIEKRRRYHQCQQCETKFHSVELDPADW